MAETLSADQAAADPWKVVPREEFVERQERAREATAALGLDGAVVWSRGGAFMDMSADVLYLTNHYSQQPYMGDEAGIGSARSHGVCVLPLDGPSTVVVDVPWWRRDLVVADEVRPTIHVVQAAAQAIRDAGLERGRIAVVGASYMTAAAYLGLAEELPHAQLIRADTLIEDLRIIKSPAEQELIRRACALGNRTLEALIDAVVEGATEADAQAAAAQTLIAGGGVLYDAACSSGPWRGGARDGGLPRRRARTRAHVGGSVADARRPGPDQRRDVPRRRDPPRAPIDRRRDVRAQRPRDRRRLRGPDDGPLALVVSRDEFLAQRRIAVLATEDPDGSTYLTAIWFAYEDGAFLVPTAATSRKGRNARERPRGAILVDSRGPAFCGVAASGRIELVEGEAALEINARVHRRYVTEAGMADPELGGSLTAGDDVTLRLVPERWQEWDLEPYFGTKLSDPRFAEPLAP